jgi:hypothetical protein
LSGVLSSLEGAKPQMQRWLEEWQQPEYMAEDQSWRTELNQKAQQHMHELDAAVFPYQSRMRAPRPWDPPAMGDDSDPLGGSGDAAGGSGGGGASGNGGSAGPPSIPPVPPLDHISAGSGPAGGSSAPATGPVLSGGPGPGRGSAPGPVDAPIGAGPQVGPGPSGSLWVDTPAGRALRAGAVIGMPPPPTTGSPDGAGTRTGGRQPGRPSAAAVSGEPVGSGERGGGGMLGAPYGGGMRPRQDRRGGRRSEPYVEWKVREGLPPVLEPGPEPTHDPGPGVIGIDR